MFSIPNESDAGNARQAQVDAIDLAILARAISGHGVLEGLEVTERATPDMNVVVDEGCAIYAGEAFSDAGSAALAIGAADATYGRFDLIELDPDTGLNVIAGTAGASPVFPAIGADDVILAAVYVGAGVTEITTADIIDKRGFVQRGTPCHREATRAVWANTSALETVFTWALPRHLLRRGGLWDGAVRVELALQAVTAVSSHTWRVRILLGGTVLFDDTTGSWTSVSYTIPCKLSFLLALNDASDEWTLHGSMNAPAADGAGTGEGNISTDEEELSSAFSGRSDGALDHDTGDLTLVVEIAMSVANASIKVQRNYAIVEVL